MHLDQEIRNQLREYWRLLEGPVEFVASLTDDRVSTEMLTLLTDLSSLSPLLHVRHASLDRTPSFRVQRPNDGVGVTFAVIPHGYHFSSLVLAILHVSGRTPKINASLAERIRLISIPCHFETYMNYHCHHCPDVVQHLNALCVLNPLIQHVTVEHETKEASHANVPTVLLNGALFGSGRMSIEDIVRRLDNTKPSFQPLSSSPYDVLIVGGGDSGLAAAHYAACQGMRAAIVAETFTAPLSFDYEIDIINRQRADTLQIATAANIPLFTLTLENGMTIRSKTIIIATGAANWQTGIRHCTEWLQDCVLQCTSVGEVIVSQTGATSVPGIFAAGSCSNMGCEGETACRSALTFLQQNRS